MKIVRIGFFGGGAALVVCFFFNEALVEKPWAKADVILSHNIGINLVIIVLFSLTNLSNASLVPNFLIGIAGLRPEQIGPLFLVYAALPIIAMLPLSNWLIRKFDARLVMAGGLSAFFLAGLLGTQLTHVWALDDFRAIVLLQAIGQSLTLLPIIIVALSNSDPQRATAFAAYLQVVRLGGAEIGSAVMSTWLRVREQVHSNLLGQHVTDGHIVTDRLARLTAGFSADGSGVAHNRSVATLSQIVQREANTLAYIDGFWLTVWFAVAALACVACLKAAPSGPFTPQNN